MRRWLWWRRNVEACTDVAAVVAVIVAVMLVSACTHMVVRRQYSVQGEVQIDSSAGGCDRQRTCLHLRHVQLTASERAVQFADVGSVAYVLRCEKRRQNTLFKVVEEVEHRVHQSRLWNSVLVFWHLARLGCKPLGPARTADACLALTATIRVRRTLGTFSAHASSAW